MPKFSEASKKKLLTCAEPLQIICNEAIEIFDFTVLEGQRSEARQAAMYEQGLSKLLWPNSKHNKEPSMAIDVAPYPIDWNNEERFYLLAGIFFAIAKRHNIKLRWGGDWDRDWQFNDQTFNDLPHFELI